MVDFAKKYMSSIESGGGVVGSLGTAAKGVGKDIAGKFSRKSIVSAALPGDDLLSVLGRKALGGGKDKSDNVKKKELAGEVTQVTKAVQEGSAQEMSILKSIAKNSMSLPGIARDVNVLRQNMQKLVKIEGGKKATGADDYFMKQDQREAALEADTGEGATKVVEKEADDAKSGGGILGMIKKFANTFMGALKKLFSKKMLMKLVTKIFLPLAIIATLFKGIKAGFDDYKKTGSLSSAIMAGLGGMLEFLTFGFFNRETIENIGAKLSKFVAPVFEKMGEIFSSIKKTIINGLNAILPKGMQIGGGGDAGGDVEPEKVKEGAAGNVKSGSDAKKEMEQIIESGTTTEVEKKSGKGFKEETTTTKTVTVQKDSAPTSELGPGSLKGETQEEMDARLGYKPNQGRSNLSPARRAYLEKKRAEKKKRQASGSPEPVEDSPESVNKYELTEEDLNAEYGGYGASPAYDEDAGPDYDEDAEYDPAEEEKLSRIMTADELRAEEPGISDEDIKLEQEEQQRDLDQQKKNMEKMKAMEMEAYAADDARSGGSKGITASPVEVPPPAPSGGAAMSEKSSQLSESKRMESAADTGDMVNNTTNNNNQGSTGGGGKGKPADVFDSTLNEALAN